MIRDSESGGHPLKTGVRENFSKEGPVGRESEKAGCAGVFDNCARKTVDGMCKGPGA